MKRQKTVEKQVALYTNQIIDRKIAGDILSNVDVRDAMNWVIASGRDVRFVNIAALMREEGIWKFWTWRDMEEVFTDLLPKWADEGAIDGPKWKLVYLWYRLTYRVHQQFVLSYYVEDEKTHEHGAYPPGTLRMTGLNVITGHFPNNGGVFELDFRTEYPRLCADMGKLKHEDLFSEFIMDNDLFYRHDDPILKALHEKYRSDNRYNLILEELRTIYGFKDVIDGLYLDYAQIISEFAREFRLIILRKSVYGGLDFGEKNITENQKKIRLRFPREIFPGRIMVGCAACSIPTSIQCSCPCATPYCGKQCQKEHHSLV